MAREEKRDMEARPDNTNVEGESVITVEDLTRELVELRNEFLAYIKNSTKMFEKASEAIKSLTVQ